METFLVYYMYIMIAINIFGCKLGKERKIGENGGGLLCMCLGPIGLLITFLSPKI